MKRVYTKPALLLEEFIPQEYVAICFNMYCDVDKYTEDNPAPNNSWYYYKDNTGKDNDGYAQNGWDELDTHGKYCMQMPTVYNDNTGKWTIVDTSGQGVGLINRTGRNDDLLFWVDGKSYTLDQWSQVKNESNLIVTWVEKDSKTGDQWNHVGHVVLNGQNHS